jgi:hypothetical protein
MRSRRFRNQSQQGEAELDVLNVSRAARFYSLGVIAEIDIWRAAYLMLRWYGDTARAEAIRRIDEHIAAGDFPGVAIWLRVIDAVEQLSNTTPPGPAH